MFPRTTGLMSVVWLSLVPFQWVSAGTLIQEEVSTYLQIFGNAPIGQTFTAEDASVARIGFNIDDFNNELFNGETILRLYKSDTIAGAPIYVGAQEIAPGSQGFVFFDTPGFPLTIGTAYTLELERLNPRWGLGANQHQFGDGSPIPGHDDYTGGHAIINGQPALGYDLSFLVADFIPADGDGNGDGWVDGLDYLIWADNFGTHPGFDGDISDGDYNYDGVVDGLDYLLWAQNLGTHSTTTLPEPSALSLLLVGWLSTSLRRRPHRAISNWQGPSLSCF